MVTPSRYIAGLHRYGGEFLRWAAAQSHGGVGYGGHGHQEYRGRPDGRPVDRRMKEARDELVRALRELPEDRRQQALKELLAELAQLDSLL